MVAQAKLCLCWQSPEPGQLDRQTQSVSKAELQERLQVQRLSPRAGPRRYSAGLEAVHNCFAAHGVLALYQAFEAALATHLLVHDHFLLIEVYSPSATCLPNC
jgi:hypothetical protein